MNNYALLKKYISVFQKKKVSLQACFSYHKLSIPFFSRDKGAYDDVETNIDFESLIQSSWQINGQDFTLLTKTPPDKQDVYVCIEQEIETSGMNCASVFNVCKVNSSEFTQ